MALEDTAFSPSARLYSEELGLGALVGRYVVSEVCFRGTIATLYRAREEISGRVAALKVMHSQFAQTSKFLKRFEQEAEALRRLHHPNIVEIWDAGELHDGRPYLAMEWLDGQNLAEELRRHGPFSVQETVSILRTIGNALSAAHDIGILHRDLKAQNIMVVRRGDVAEYKLVDFGIAKFLETSPSPSGGLTSTGAVLGTPIAMAPEQIRGAPVDVRTDVYSLGVLLYQLLTGHPPFQAASTIELEEMHFYAAPPRPSQRVSVPVVVDKAVLRCLQKKPEDRFQSVSALLSFLEQPTSPHSSEAIGLFCSIDFDGSEEKSWLEHAEAALRAAKHACRQAGLNAFLSTGNGFLAAELLALDPEAEQTLRRHVIETALQLCAELSGSPRRRLRPSITVHVASAEMETQPNGETELTAGELLTLAQWISEKPGVVATLAAISGLESDFPTQPIPERPNYFQLLPSPAGGKELG